MKCFKIENNKIKISFEIPIPFHNMEEDSEGEATLIDQVGFRLTPSPVVEESNDSDDVNVADHKIFSNKKLIFLLPVLLLLILLMATLPPFIESREAYKNAEQLLASGDYIGARSAFEALGSYADSYTKIQEIDNYILEQKKTEETEANAKMAAEARAAEAIAKAKAEKLKQEELEKKKEEAEATKLSELQAAAQAEALKQQFLTLIQNGSLQDALNILSSTDIEIENRDRYTELINFYIPYCKVWSLHLGDSGLLPRSVGYEGTCGKLTSSVSIYDDKAVMHLIDGEGRFKAELSSPLGENNFVKLPSEGEIYYYYFFINANNDMVYSQYLENGKSTGSCEYSPA